MYHWGMMWCFHIRTHCRIHLNNSKHDHPFKHHFFQLETIIVPFLVCKLCSILLLLITIFSSEQKHSSLLKTLLLFLF